MESYIHPNTTLEDTRVQGPGIGYSRIKSNTKKAIIKNIVNTALILIVIIFLIIFIDTQVGLETFTMAFEAVGVIVTAGQIITYTIIIALVICIGMLIANYMALNNIRYELYDNRLRYYETQLLVMVKSEDILYDNIMKINYKNDGLMSKLLSCGDIIIGLTNYKKDNIILESIDDPEQVARLIQTKMSEYNMHKQMIYQESNKINNILKKF